MNTWRIVVGDALERLRELDAGSVQTCVTSPPYFGLRDYGTGSWEGGDEGCDHIRWVASKPDDPGIRSSTLQSNKRTPELSAGTLAHLEQQGKAAQYRSECGKCGATRTDSQVGLEATPEEYVARLVEVFREVRRVLRDDGTLWLNLGDSYANNPSSAVNRNGLTGSLNDGKVDFPVREGTRGSQQRATLPQGIKPKDLLGIPWMVAFALRADGWYLRSDVVWAKPNPMPESVTDRPTKAHEMVFLLAKGQAKTRVVALSDLRSERVHLGNDLGSNDPHLWADEFAVRLATSVLDGAEFEKNLGLPPLDAEVWQKRPDDNDGFGVAGLPVEHRAAVFATRLLSTHGTAKEFLCELDGLGVTLAEHNKFLVGGGPTVFALPPGVDRYGETAIAIHDAGQIRQVDFASHEVKTSRPSGCSYFYDADGIREAHEGPMTERRMTIGIEQQGNKLESRYNEHGRNTDSSFSGGLNPAGRNKRSVWTVATAPFPGAHFAVFPPKLIEPCVLAGSAEDACGVCGAPWERVVEREAPMLPDLRPKDIRTHLGASDKSTLGQSRTGAFRPDGTPRTGVNHTVDWQPSCRCHCGTQDALPDDPLHARPFVREPDNSGSSVVLDPFAGAGTTGLVATRLGRSFIGIELNPEYAELARDRIRDDAPLMNYLIEAS